MARRKNRVRARAQAAADSVSPTEVLRRRARRLAEKGQCRKAALALRELAQRTEDPCAWAAFGSMLVRARRVQDAVHAYHRSMWLHRKAGALARARTVAQMIIELDPMDEAASRMVARAA